MSLIKGKSRLPSIKIIIGSVILDNLDGIVMYNLGMVGGRRTGWGVESSPRIIKNGLNKRP